MESLEPSTLSPASHQAVDHAVTLPEAACVIVDECEPSITETEAPGVLAPVENVERDESVVTELESAKVSPSIH